MRSAWVAGATTVWMAILIVAVSADDAPPVIAEEPLTDSDRDHWSFRPVVRPMVPEVRYADWCRNPVDRFVLARLEAEGLSPAPVASSRTLERRLYYGLTGLPSADGPPDSFDALVDRLLASPAYGERWGQHWLDLARFAQTDGFEHDLERPEAWRYRDWVISALNANLPFDQFVSWQLAGDELAPDDPAAVIATGFLLCGPDMPDLNLQDERRHNFLNDLTGTVGSTLLGLQVGCAACHDHKYDPISQFDFYRLRACFDPLELFRDLPLPPAAELMAGPPEKGRVARESSATAPASRLFVRGDFRRAGPEIEPAGLRVVSARLPDPMPPVDLTRTTGRRTRLAQWICSRDHPLTARVIANRVWQWHFGRGLVNTPSDFGKFGADPSHPELLDWLACELVDSHWDLKYLQRLILHSAAWRQASALATAQPHSAGSSAAHEAWRRSLERDPDNRLLSRFTRRRLDGEEIRDTLLQISGSLNRQSGGPGVRPPLPPEIVATLLANQWKPSSEPADHVRRSIYLFVRRNLRYPLFEAFDRPDANASCPQRSRSTIAPQSLAMMNSDLALASAEGCAARILSPEAAGLPSRGAAAIRLILRREATLDEAAIADDFLERESRRLATTPAAVTDSVSPAESARQATDPERVALVELCLGLINLNEFLYID